MLLVCEKTNDYTFQNPKAEGNFASYSTLFISMPKFGIYFLFIFFQVKNLAIC